MVTYTDYLALQPSSRHEGFWGAQGNANGKVMRVMMMMLMMVMAMVMQLMRGIQGAGLNRG